MKQKMKDQHKVRMQEVAMDSNFRNLTVSGSRVLGCKVLGLYVLGVRVLGCRVCRNSERLAALVRTRKGGERVWGLGFWDTGF